MRRFLLRIVLPLGALLALAWGAALLAGRTFRAHSAAVPPGQTLRTGPERGITSTLALAAAGEPGVRLVVTGKVVTREREPVAGYPIVVYHADASGSYGTRPDNPRHARLRGTLVTDSLGRYEVHTVRPGGYGPHIHFILGGLTGSSEELRFAADSIHTDRRLPTVPRVGSGGPTIDDPFATERPVTRDPDGVLHVVRDFRVDAALRRPISPPPRLP